MIKQLILSLPSRGACAVTLVLAAALSPILADAVPASPAAGSPEATYQSERADCMAGRTQQDQKTCLREAVSARDAARKGLLKTEDAQTLHANEMERCKLQPKGGPRKDCKLLVNGAGTVSGSVAGGGELKELVQVVPAEPSASQSKR